MWRDVGGHAHRDAARAVDQKVGEARRQYAWLAVRSVVVRLEIDGILVDVLEDLVRHLGQPRLGVTHGRRRVAVDGTEIALPVDQRHPHRPVLRHAHQGVVDRGVAVRMVLAHHVGDGTGRLHMLAVPVIAALMRRIEDTAVDGLQPVAHVRQRAGDDDAHGVIEIAALHFLDDRDRLDAGWAVRPARCVLVGQIGSRNLGIMFHFYIGSRANSPMARGVFQN